MDRFVSQDSDSMMGGKSSQILDPRSLGNECLEKIIQSRKNVKVSVPH